MLLVNTSSVYVKSDPNNLPSTLHLIQNLNLTISYISEDEIIEALKSCKNTMTSGLDGIPSFFLKDCASVLVKPLYLLFNLILRQSSVNGKMLLFIQSLKRATKPM